MNTDTIMNNTPAEATITPTLAAVSVKVTRGDEMRRFAYQGKSFQELKEIIAQLFAIPSADFSLQYQDDEKERVTLSTDAELKEAIQLHKYILRFFVNVTKPSAGDLFLPSHPHPHPHPHHHGHHHHHGVAPPPPPPPPHVVAVEGEVEPPYGHHGHGRHGHGPYGYGRHGHGPYGRFGGGHKRCLDKEDKEAMKCERKKWKKQRKCESSSSSSSSSSSEDEGQKKQRKEMRQLMKATKMSIKATWAPTKEANPGQWAVNRKLMRKEIQLAKRLIRDQVKNSSSSPSSNENNTAAAAAVAAKVSVSGAEMQA